MRPSARFLLTVLAAERSRLPNPSEHAIMPELVSKEMLGPVVRRGDEQWFSIVRWTLASLIAAEELGITSSNIDSLKASANIDIRRFLGLEADLGQGREHPILQERGRGLVQANVEDDLLVAGGGHPRR